MFENWREVGADTKKKELDSEFFGLLTCQVDRRKGQRATEGLEGYISIGRVRSLKVDININSVKIRSSESKCKRKGSIPSISETCNAEG